MEYTLSFEVAERFLKETLHLDVDVSKKEESLFQIVQRFMEKIPFHNVLLMAQPCGERTVPTVPESIQCVLDGIGGTCNVLNTFMYSLLKTLDFDVDVILSSVKKPDSNNHVAMVIKGLRRPGDKWLVDVGFGSPCFEPVNLDFEEESPTFTQSYLTFKYAKRGETYIRLQKVTTAKTFPVVENGWAHAYYFSLEPVTLSTVLRYIDINVYKNTDPFNWFQYSLRICGFQPDGKAVVVRDGVFFKEDDSGVLRKEAIEGDVVDAVHEQFPMIPKDSLITALANNNKSTSTK